MSPEMSDRDNSRGLRFGRTHPGYWRERIFRRVRAEGTDPNYTAKIQHGGRRENFPLHSANKSTSASLAAEIYRVIVTQGWETAIAMHKPKPSEPERQSATVGEVITTASQISSARRHTIDCYAKALRRIVSEIKGIQDGRKFDAFQGGREEWRQKVDAVILGSISPSDVVAWKNGRLREAQRNPIEKRHAIVTINSLIRNAKALMGKKILPFVEQKLLISRPLPFEGVPLEKSPSLRYTSRVDAYDILSAARTELSESDPEAFKVLVLALVCGLRRSEIDNLLWQAFDFTKAVLRVESNEFHELKSEDSAGEIDLDADTAALFQGFRQNSGEKLFVIESANPARRDTKSRCYRCNSIFDRVNSWLREHGVDSIKPLHTMRKEIGSIIAGEQGIFEASRYLRHSDIRITSAFYADKKKTVTPKAFSGLLTKSSEMP
jgi:integrase